MSFIYKIVALFFILASFFNCQKDVKKIGREQPPVQGVILPVLKPPDVIELASRPEPQRISIPEKPGGSYIQQGIYKGKKVDLFPPVVKPAGVLYVTQNYTTEQGLALDTVLSSYRDAEGSLWFGTWGGGISHYDGNNFTNYTQLAGLSRDSVSAITGDKQGNIWFGLKYGGLYLFDGRVLTAFFKEGELAGHTINDIFVDSRGTLWIGTERGLNIYKDGRPKTITQEDGLPNNDVRVILEDDEENLWFGTFGGGASRFDGKMFKTFKDTDGLSSNFILSGLKDSKGNLWFGTDNGLTRFDGKSFTSFAEKEGLNDPPLSMTEDKTGNIWLGTESRIYLFDGKLFKAFGKEQGFNINNVNTMLIDKIGNLWFGTEGSGVVRFDGEAFTNFTTSQGLVNNIGRGILEDRQKNLWISTSGGISSYDGKTFTNFTVEQGLSSPKVTGSLLDSRGNIWFGSHNGASRYDGQSFTNYTKDQGLIGNLVNVIIEDNDRNLWFGTDEGVSKFDGRTFINFSKDQGLVDSYISSILLDSHGNLWFGTNGGISVFDGKIFTSYTKNEGLPANPITRILEDQERNVWIGTYGYGLIRFDGKSFLNFSTQNGLPNNTVYQVITTEQGDLAIGTNLGVTLLKGFTKIPESVLVELPSQNKLRNSELKSYMPIFEIYNTFTGYPIKDTSSGQNSIFLDSRGILWIGTGSDKTGLVEFDYKALHKSKDPPVLEFTKIKLNNEDIIWYDLENADDTKFKTPPYVTEEAVKLGKLLDEQQREAMHKTYEDVQFDGISKFYYIPENLKIPYSANSLTLEFSAIEPAFPQDVLYQYKMSGYDKHWSPISNNRKAVYGNMFEGNYVFSVKARSPFGVWSEPINYSFRVFPPWYRNWLAYLIYASSLLTGGYLAYRSRIKSLKERQEQLERLYAATERFVPKAFLNLLKKDHIENVKLGDSTELELTIMFSDIRGFTTIAEKQSPREAFAFVNDYLAVMAPIIRENHGFINQFHGDGIMALFPRKADDSIKAIQKMSEALSTYNQEQTKKNKQQLSVGYGLNTGLTMLGIIGEQERMEANVISDAINLAARTESLNKFYGTNFLVTEGTMQALSGEEKYLSRIVDKVRVKGKSAAVYIYEIYMKSQEGEEEFINAYESAFKQYEKGEFEDALRLFTECRILKPESKSVEVFIHRSEALLNSPPAQWDGTFEMTHK